MTVLWYFILIKIPYNHLIKVLYAYNVNKISVIGKVSNFLAKRENFGSELNQDAKSYFISNDKTQVFGRKGRNLESYKMNTSSWLVFTSIPILI